MLSVPQNNVMNMNNAMDTDYHQDTKLGCSNSFDMNKQQTQNGPSFYVGWMNERYTCIIPYPLLGT